MNFNSPISPGWTLQVACLSLCACCVAVGVHKVAWCLIACVRVCLAKIQMSLPCLFVNRWSCQNVWCSLKREEITFLFKPFCRGFAWYEMTVIIKLTQQQPFCLFENTRPYTSTFAFTAVRVKSYMYSANRTCYGNGTGLLVTRKEKIPPKNDGISIKKDICFIKCNLTVCLDLHVTF